MLSDKQAVQLIQQAEQAREFSYAPYSQFCTGAALLSADGKVFTGCNVENASHSATVCAERTALFKAVSQGVRQFAAIAVVGGEDEICVPCGICLQALSEFCSGTFLVVAAKNQADFKIVKLEDILPMPFKLKQ